MGFNINETYGTEDEFVDKLMEDINPLEYREMIALFPEHRVKEAIKSDMLMSNECWKVECEDGTALALFGVLRQGEVNIIWCLCTNLVQEYKIEFQRISRKIIYAWACKYGKLCNSVGVFNNPSRLWLTSLGAEFTDNIEVNGEQFIKFELTKNGMERAGIKGRRAWDV